MKKELLETGKIVSTHGLHGEVKILPWADSPEFLLEFDRVFLGKREYAVEDARVQKTCVLMKLEGIDTVEDAAKLRDQVRYELKKIQLQLGITTIYVTHDQTEAMTMADHIVLLKDGHIMQQGTPDELYDHPANEFVAGFLGTPQINLFPCKVVRRDGGLTLDAGDFAISVPDALKACLEDYEGRKVDLGIRPSDFELAHDGANAIHAHVDSIEPLGDAYLIYVRVGEKVVVFKYTGEKKPEQKELVLTANLEKLHLFDPETQNRINA